MNKSVVSLCEVKDVKGRGVQLGTYIVLKRKNNNDNMNNNKKKDAFLLSKKNSLTFRFAKMWHFV